MATERNEEVLTKVREKLEKYPDLSSRQLHDLAVRLDTSLATLPLRSFHARYVLPIKRERAIAEGRVVLGRKRGSRTRKRAKAARQSGGTRTSRRQVELAEQRAHVRNIVLRFARELTAAESRAAVVDVIADLDRWVDEILAEPARQNGETAAE